MNVTRDYKNHCYFVKEKIHNQTFVLKFEEYERTLGCITFNVVLGVYNKRKHATLNENNVILTGEHPFETVGKTIRAFKLLEEEIADLPCPKKKITVNWTDNKRRDVYAKYLLKHGYVFDKCDGTKCLTKII